MTQSHRRGRELHSMNPGTEQTTQASGPAERSPIVDIALNTDLADIPEGPPCEACGYPTQKSYLEHVAVGDHVRVRARKAAGFRCLDCGTEYYSHEAMAESLSKARDIMLQWGDDEAAEALVGSITRYRQLIEGRRGAGRIRNA